jgi:hypothetical protein
VVILTSVGDWHAATSAESVDACLVKPVRQSQLFDILANAQARQPKKAERAPAPTEFLPVDGQAVRMLE